MLDFVLNEEEEVVTVVLQLQHHQVILPHHTYLKLLNLLSRLLAVRLDFLPVGQQRKVLELLVIVVDVVVYVDVLVVGCQGRPALVDGCCACSTARPPAHPPTPPPAAHAPADLP